MLLQNLIISLPTYPKFCWYATGSTHIFHLGPRSLILWFDQYIKTEFSHEPLAQLNSNFMRRLLIISLQKFIQNILVKWQMAATLKYGKNFLKIFSRTRRPVTLGLGM